MKQENLAVQVVLVEAEDKVLVQDLEMLEVILHQKEIMVVQVVDGLLQVAVVPHSLVLVELVIIVVILEVMVEMDLLHILLGVPQQAQDRIFLELVGMQAAAEEAVW
jgi:hypothetical protein